MLGWVVVVLGFWQYWSGARDLFIDKAHTALGIFPVFFPCMLPAAYSALRHFFLLKSNLWLIVHLVLGHWQDHKKHFYMKLECCSTQTILLLAHTALVMRTTVMTTRPLILAPCAVVMCVFHNNHDCTCYKSSAGEVFVAGPFLMGAVSVTGVQGK